MTISSDDVIKMTMCDNRTMETMGKFQNVSNKLKTGTLGNQSMENTKIIISNPKI